MAAAEVIYFFLIDNVQKLPMKGKNIAVFVGWGHSHFSAKVESSLFCVCLCGCVL